MGRAQAVVRKYDCHYMNILVLINCDILLRGNVWAGVLGKTVGSFINLVGLSVAEPQLIIRK